MAIQLPPNLPVGFRFHPTDVELVTSYLKPKILGKAYDDDAIAEVNLCKQEPWELPLKSKIKVSNDRSWYFLCRREYSKRKRSEWKRSTKTGYWKISSPPRMIRDENTKVCIGSKKTLVFHTGSFPGKRTNWVMQEIDLDPDTFTIPTQMATYAVCRLKKTNKNVETPQVEVMPNLEHQVSPPSTQAVNLEMPIDPEVDSGPIEGQLTDDDIRRILSDESPEDFADRCLVDDVDNTILLTENYGTQATLKRSYFGDGPGGSDTDAEGANTPYFPYVLQAESLDSEEEPSVIARKESSSHIVTSVRELCKWLNVVFGLVFFLIFVRELCKWLNVAFGLVLFLIFVRELCKWLNVVLEAGDRAQQRLRSKLCVLF